jgi:DNA-binding MarR family transcriptional regulator
MARTGSGPRLSLIAKSLFSLRSQRRFSANSALKDFGNRTPAEAAKAQPVSYETTLLVRDSCLCLHVQRAARALARRFDEALRPLGLTNGQFSLMMSLNRPEPPAMGSVASLLAMDRTTLTAALKPLARRGLIKITKDHGDRRTRLLELTPQGRKLLARAVPVWTSTHAAVEANLGPGEPGRLRKNLGTLS